MQVRAVPFNQTGFLPDTTQAFIDHNPDLLKLLPYPHKLESVDDVLAQRAAFPQSKREALHQVLTEQYAFLTDDEKAGSKVWQHIQALKKEDTYTVTTGQQLHIFLGPLFFAYKIISAVKLAEALQQRYPGKTIIPIFWLASEDHDIEEINHLSLFNEPYSWQPEGKGATGRLSCNGLHELSLQLLKRLEGEQDAAAIIEVFDRYYSNSKSLAEATTKIIHHFFGHLGVVVLNADHRVLKTDFIPYVKEDIFNGLNFPVVSQANKQLKQSGFASQLNPREINMFYLQDNLRERLICEQGIYKVLNTEITFTGDALEQEILSYPERFSPNAVLRPLYQEVVLPNLAYVAGGSELNYWLELPGMFKANNVPYPLPYLRNSLQFIGNKQYAFLEQHQVPMEQMFLSEPELKNYLIAHFSGQNPVRLALEERKQNNDVLLKALSALVPERLKEIKKHLEQELTTYKDIEVRATEILFNKSEAVINKMLKLKAEAFNPSNLQERRISCLQHMAVYGGFWLNIAELSTDTSPGLYKYIIVN